MAKPRGEIHQFKLMAKPSGYTQWLNSMNWTNG
jgi:hypothetical protein